MNIEELDQEVSLAINSLDSSFTDPVWKFFSDKEPWFLMYAVILGFFFWNLGWKKAIVVVLSCVLTVVFCDQLGNIVKDAVERLRPSWNEKMITAGLNLLEGKGNMYGFFSAHAANAMGFAICSYMGFKNDTGRSYKYYGWFIYIWALLVGISRVFVGKHFLGDVLTGFAAGLVFGYLFALLGRYIISKFSLQDRR